MTNEMYKTISSLNDQALQVLKAAPAEPECTPEENEVFAELANFVNAFFNAFKRLPNDNALRKSCETCYFKGKERQDDPCWKCKFGLYLGYADMYIPNNAEEEK